MQTIFITGHRGDIGSLLKDRLELKGYQVVVQNNPQLRLEDGNYFDDIPNPEKIDVLYHLAAKTFVPLSWDKPDEFIKSNVLGTSKVLEFCRKYNIKLIYISSYAYGIPQYLPIDENHSVLSVNPYALSKNMAEELCVFYGKNYNLKYNIIRPFNIFGSLKNKALLVPEIIEQINHKDAIKVKDLTPKRDYLFIDDAIDFFITSINKFTNDIYNLGSGQSYSVKQIVDTCQKVWGTQLPVISSDTVRKNEIPETKASINKAKNVFGWEPKYNLLTGLKLLKERLD